MRSTVVPSCHAPAVLGHPSEVSAAFLAVDRLKQEIKDRLRIGRRGDIKLDDDIDIMLVLGDPRGDGGAGSEAPARVAFDHPVVQGASLAVHVLAQRAEILLRGLLLGFAELNAPSNVHQQSVGLGQLGPRPRKCNVHR
jgi:hypothetical protein